MTSALHGPKMVHAKESPVRVKQMAVTIEMILQDCLSMHGIFGEFVLEGLVLNYVLNDEKSVFLCVSKPTGMRLDC